MQKLNINVDIFVLVFVIVMFLICLTLLLFKNFLNKVILLVTILAGAFFTSLGLILQYQDNYSYILTYLLFFVLMVVTMMIVIRKIKFNDYLDVENSFKRYDKIFIALGILALFLKFSTLIYPQFKLGNLFKIPGYQVNVYKFQEILVNNSNGIYWIISRLEVMCYPFFFILLYKLKNKPIKCISLFLFYHYIDFAREQYISRSALVVYIIFIWIYLYEEKILSRKKLIILGLILIFTIIPLVNILETVRTGGIVNSNTSFFDNIVHLINQEGYCQQFLDVTNTFSKELSFIKYIISSISSPLFFLPDIDFPVLSYAFTEKILGLSYGDANYYVMLPGAFGEGVMIFGKYFAWIYGIFIGYFVGKADRVFTRVSFLKLWGIMYILDVARSFRGGIQTFFIATLNTSLLLIIVFLVLNLANKHKA